jgi:Flp pilus assembly protein TadG
MQVMRRSAAKPAAKLETLSGISRGCSRLRGRKQRGSALVEFAVVMTFMLVPLVVGMATFAIFLDNNMILTEAVNVGARQLAVSRNATTDPCTMVTTAITNTYKSGAMESSTPSLTFTIVMDNKTQTYGPTTGIFSCSGTPTSGGPSYLVQNTAATVTVTHQIASIFPAFGNFEIKGQSTELVQ